MKTIYAVSISIFGCAPAVAGRIAELFSEGIFGCHWGEEVAQVEIAHPGGKWKNYGKIRVYTVRDGRAVLGVEREPKSNILFGFSNEARLSSVSIEFPFKTAKFGELMSAAIENFGRPLTSNDEKIDLRYSLTEMTGIYWPEDAGASVSLVTQTTGFTTITALTISKVSVTPQKSIGELGFN